MNFADTNWLEAMFFNLAGATRLLSFDQTLKALAVVEGLEVFPGLNEAGKTLLARLKR